MVHFLRDKQNNTLIECEVTSDDLSAAVYLGNYTTHLLRKIKKSDYLDFIFNFDYLNEIRGKFWEDEPGVQNMEEFVAEEFSKAANRWDLNYVTD
jgi:hypothetical protein